MSTIGLYVHELTAARTGPYKVFSNLSAGLQMLGHTVVVNRTADLVGCLQDNPLIMGLPEKTPIGPNIFILPKDRPELMSRYRTIVVPSHWVKDKYNRFDVTAGKNVVVWSVGIDHDAFNVDRSNIDTDCLLYWKGRDELIPFVQVWLSKRGQSYQILKYGEYTEEQFKGTLSKCRYAVLLTGTESQGIAYMEMLAAGVPCFVFDKKDWNGHPATSVPYFDDRCGVVSEYGKHEENFDVFLNKLDSYKPQEYIIEGHTLRHGAENYMRILQEAT